MRVLITGARGQLGTDLVRVCKAAGDEVYATDLPELDITDRDQVLSTITTLRPTAVLNLAAFTNVDGNEGDPDLAYRLNALAVRYVAEGCRRTGAHLLQVSTDYVFSGDKPTAYLEWDEPGPQSVYGASKLAGEHEAGPDATIVRTSWVCGEHGNNMVKTIVRLAAERPHLAFVNDQRGHPTFTSDLAPMLRRLALDRRSGLHHVTNQGPVSWFEFAQAVVLAMGKDAQMVTPITTDDLQPPRAAKRPVNSVLDNAVLRLSGLPLLPDFRDTLAVVVGQLMA